MRFYSGAIASGQVRHDCGQVSVLISQHWEILDGRSEVLHLAAVHEAGVKVLNVPVHPGEMVARVAAFLARLAGKVGVVDTCFWETVG